MSDISKIKYPIDPLAFISDEKKDGEESEVEKVNRLMDDIKQHRPYYTEPHRQLLNRVKGKTAITRHEAKVIYMIAGRIKCTEQSDSTKRE